MTRTTKPRKPRAKAEKPTCLCPAYCIADEHPNAELEDVPPVGISNAAQLEIERAAGKREGIQLCKDVVDRRGAEHVRKGFWRLFHLARAGECVDILKDFEGLCSNSATDNPRSATD